MDPWLAVGAATGVVGAAILVAGVLAASAQRRNSAAAYLTSLDDHRSAGSDDHPDEFARRLSQPRLERLVAPTLQRFVGLVGSVTPSDHRVRVRTRLAQAGLDFRRRPEEVIAAEVIGAAVGAGIGIALGLAGALDPTAAAVCTAGLGLVGLATPTAWLSHQVDARVHAIRADLPDILDLLAISVEAGVGLEGALQVVTDRFDSPLADELGRTLQEMGLGLTRRDALTNLKQRSQVPELSSFVGALIQADTLGMPLGRVLKLQATEMRAKRRQWARERAAKLPVKILFPLVMCIFPAVLVVVLGPAVSQIGEALK